MRALAVVLAVLAALPSTLPGQQRQCEPTQNPKTLPPVSALLDSARFVRGLSPSDLAPKGLLLFSLVYSESDSFPQIHVIVASIDSAGLLFANAFVSRKSKNLWAVRVRVSGGDALVVTVERSIYCPPVLVTKPDRLSQRVLVYLHPGDRVMPGLNFRINADVIIAETGVVEEVRLSQSSGMRELDDQIVQELRMRRYLPALIDGFPVASWYRTDGRTMRL